jgi:hypothetical protein
METVNSKKQMHGELELAQERLAALRSGKRQPGTYGPPISSGSGMKIAIDLQRKKIEALRAQLKKPTSKTP